MRIGFDATVLGPRSRHTGTGQYTERLLQHLPRLACDDEFILYGNPPAGTEWRSNVRWAPLGRIPAGRLSSLASHLLIFPWQARRDRLDVLHVPTVHTRPSLPPVPRMAGCPLVVTVHDLIPITFYGQAGNHMPRRMRLYYRWNLKAAIKADGIITVSETSRREMIELLKMPEHKVITVYNGIDVDSWSGFSADRRPNPYSRGKPYLLFGGSHEPRKNLLRLLDAFELAVGKGIPHDLVMVVDAGSGHAENTLRYASGLRCTDRLHFLSSLEEPALIALYRGADLFVFPSLSEGFGLPPLQAMASGVPVLASDLPVLHEVLGNAARYVDPTDVMSIAGGMVGLLSDRTAVEGLVKAGHEQAARYSWAESARQTLDVYRRVLGVTSPATEEEAVKGRP